VVAVSADGKTVILDFLARNPKWLPGNNSEGPFFLNDNPKLRDVLINNSTKAFAFSGVSGAAIAPISVETTISDLNSGSNSHIAYFDIEDGVITAIHQQCLP